MVKKFVHLPTYQLYELIIETSIDPCEYYIIVKNETDLNNWLIEQEKGLTTAQREELIKTGKFEYTIGFFYRLKRLTFGTFGLTGIYMDKKIFGNSLKTIENKYKKDLRRLEKLKAEIERLAGLAQLYVIRH